MSEVESLRAWFSYNAGVREGYFEVLSKLSTSELKKDRGASFPTFLDILGHSLGGTAMWIGKMSPTLAVELEDYAGPEPETLEDLRKLSAYTNEIVDQFFSKLTERDLDKKFLVPKNPPWWPEDFHAGIRGTLLHIVEHELQHRGEVNALLWQMNVEPPILDWEDWEKAAALRSVRRSKAKR